MQMRTPRAPCTGQRREAFRAFRAFAENGRESRAQSFALRDANRARGGCTPSPAMLVTLLPRALAQVRVRLETPAKTPDTFSPHVTLAFAGASLLRQGFCMGYASCATADRAAHALDSDAKLPLETP